MFTYTLAFSQTHLPNAEAKSLSRGLCQGELEKHEISVRNREGGEIAQKISFLTMVGCAGHVLSHLHLYFGLLFSQ